MKGHVTGQGVHAVPVKTGQPDGPRTGGLAVQVNRVAGRDQEAGLQPGHRRIDVVTLRIVQIPVGLAGDNRESDVLWRVGNRGSGEGAIGRGRNRFPGRLSRLDSHPIGHSRLQPVNLELVDVVVFGDDLHPVGRFSPGSGTSRFPVQSHLSGCTGDLALSAPQGHRRGNVLPDPGRPLLWFAVPRPVSFARGSDASPDDGAGVGHFAHTQTHSQMNTRSRGRTGKARPCKSHQQDAETM